MLSEWWEVWPAYWSYNLHTWSSRIFDKTLILESFLRDNIVYYIFHRLFITFKTLLCTDTIMQEILSRFKSFYFSVLFLCCLKSYWTVFIWAKNVAFCTVVLLPHSSWNKFHFSVLNVYVILFYPNTVTHLAADLNTASDFKALIVVKVQHFCKKGL